MNKDKALDLALEALEELQPDDAYPYSLQSKAITAIKQARSAPVQEPVIKQGWDVDTLLDKPAAPVQELYIAPDLSILKHSDNCRYWDESEFCTCGATEYHELHYWKTKALAQPVQEPRGYQWLDTSVFRKKLPKNAEPDAWNALYTTPPAAQRPFVGLTDDEVIKCTPTWGGTVEDVARAIEAKLKEKNESHRQHVTDGSPCWCEPETSYTDPETGASVIVHKEPQ